MPRNLADPPSPGDRDALDKAVAEYWAAECQLERAKADPGNESAILEAGLRLADARDKLAAVHAERRMRDSRSADEETATPPPGREGGVA